MKPKELLELATLVRTSSVRTAMSLLTFAKPVLPSEASPFRHTIYTMVSDLTQYDEMIRSFVQAGFDPKFCEYRSRSSPPTACAHCMM